METTLETWFHREALSMYGFYGWRICPHWKALPCW